MDENYGPDEMPVRGIYGGARSNIGRYFINQNVAEENIRAGRSAAGTSSAGPLSDHTKRNELATNFDRIAEQSGFVITSITASQILEQLTERRACY